MGRKQTAETRARISATRIAKGLKPTAECIAKGKAAQVGPKNPNWNPNKSTDALDRMLFHTHLAPLTKHRDDYTCALCRKRGVALHSHHIKPFSICAEIRFSFVNVITLCEKCHGALHMRYGIELLPESKHLWDFLSAQLVSKSEGALETRLLRAITTYRDILAANEGDIAAAWKELESSITAYKERHGM